MAINKLTQLSLETIDRDSGGQHVRDYLAYAQRAGESGLSQELRVSFVGWTESEAEDFRAWFSLQVHRYLTAGRQEWGA